MADSTLTTPMGRLLMRLLKQFEADAQQCRCGGTKGYDYGGGGDRMKHHPSCLLVVLWPDQFQVDDSGNYDMQDDGRIRDHADCRRKRLSTGEPCQMQMGHDGDHSDMTGGIWSNESCGGWDMGQSCELELGHPGPHLRKIDYRWAVNQEEGDEDKCDSWFDGVHNDETGEDGVRCEKAQGHEDDHFAVYSDGTAATWRTPGPSSEVVFPGEDEKRAEPDAEG